MTSADIRAEIELWGGIPQLKHIADGDNFLFGSPLVETPQYCLGRIHKHAPIVIPVFSHN